MNHADHATAASGAMSADEYLDFDRSASVRHEYVGGEVFAMGGASRDHASIALAVASALSSGMPAGPCRVYVSDVKVRIQAANAYLYPDVMVACDPDDVDAYVVSRPALVVEVLSPSTAAYDRGLKHALYRSVPSLDEILLVDSQRVAVEHFVRESETRWGVAYYGAGDRFTLGSVEISVDALYRATGLAAAGG